MSLDSSISLTAFIAYCSCTLNGSSPPLDGGAWLGEHWRGLNKVEELSEVMQVAFDAIAKKNLIPMNSAADIATVPSDLFAKFQLSFYSSPEDAVIKSLGIE